jgi:cytochrome c oxidase assembly protein subunit 11
MTEAPQGRTPARGRSRDLKVALACVATVVAMVGLSFASVPLYDLFCRVTGYGGTPRLEAGASVEGVEVLDRTIAVRFDANTMPGLPWQFRADQRSVRVRLGELTTITYYAKNVSDQATTGIARFNVAPDATGPYFSKIACFCEQEQRLEAGEEVEMGVTFYVDPAILDDADTASAKAITLSYSFFPAARPAEPVAVAPAAAPDAT